MLKKCDVVIENSEAYVQYFAPAFLVKFSIWH